MIDSNAPLTEPANAEHQNKAAKALNPVTPPNEPSSFTDPKNGGHDLYRQVSSCLDRLPSGTFNNSDEKQKVAAALTFEVAKAGLKDVDHIVLSNNGNQLFAIGGGIHNPAHIRVEFNMTGLVGQSVSKSNQLWYEEFVLGRRNKQQTIEEEMLMRREIERQQQM
jgi:hypothetical protein